MRELFEDLQRDVSAHCRGRVGFGWRSATTAAADRDRGNFTSALWAGW